MRRLLRLVFYGLLTLIGILAIVLVGFRVASALRETQAPQEAAGRSARFVEVDGHAMHYMEWGPETGRPLVLVHGTVAWSGTYEDIAAPLAALGYRVIAPDMPPFGYSAKTVGSDYSRRASARRLLGFVDAIGLERFSLGVHSYGGGLVLEAAFMHPHRIESLILFDVALGLGRTGPVSPPLAPLLSIGPLRDALMSATFANPMMVGFGLKQFVHDGDTVVTAERVALYSRPSTVVGTTQAVGHWFVNGLFGDPSGTLSDDLANYRKFQPPVLIIWGEQDRTTPLDQGRFIARQFPNARLEILPGVDHIPQIEEPDLVVKLVETFLASPTDSSSGQPLRGPLN